MAFWVKIADVESANGGTFFHFGDTSVSNRYFNVGWSGGGTTYTIRVNYRYTNFTFAAIDGVVTSSNTWYHVVSQLINTSNYARVYVNGSANVDDSSPVARPDLTNVSPETHIMGFNRSSGQLSNVPGSIALPCCWNTVLTSGEVDELYGGAHPLSVQPNNVIHFWPLDEGNGNARDIVGSGDMTLTGSLPSANEPEKVWYPEPQIIPFPPAAAAAVSRRSNVFSGPFGGPLAGPIG